MSNQTTQKCIRRSSQILCMFSLTQFKSENWSIRRRRTYFTLVWIHVTLQRFEMDGEINCLKKRFKICHILYIRKPKVALSIFHFVLGPFFPFGFSYIENMANFEAFLQTINFTIHPEFLKSGASVSIWFCVLDSNQY